MGKTVVVGGGIIGAALAYELQKRGRNVALVDPEMPGSGASYGNMASIAVTEFMPVARPSVWRQLPGWLLHPEGPITVRPGYLPRLLPWFARFLAASRPSRVRALEMAGAALCQRSLTDMRVLLGEIGLGDHVSDTGCLSLYANDTEFRADAERIDMLDRYGFGYQVLGRAEIEDLEPSIDALITKAVLLPDNRTVRDPFAIVTRLVERFTGAGGTVENAKVTGFERSDRISGVRFESGAVLDADEVVLCAGAFTGRLSKLLSEPMPLETERGYHTQIMDPGLELKHSIIWPAKAFMVSPTAGGIRIGGTVEMAGLDAAPNYQRAKITLTRARTALPDLKVQETSEWMGHRPAFPDTIPLMSASAKTPGVFYATGHGHLGLTYAATNAALMADLITGAKPVLDMSPYCITRF
ncbi:D-amino acid dehydrogenase small subunit [Thalassovita autumnalis]|uniref:D-amino acid dehydrogenase small subunit n=1 Tax=Thalassovita autumnalis TaxID=2072972 RepID=A0A0P1G659_9RHOB|nr:FAD-dependent oxidoreductase [Thalassovita autumnalis]CUH70219.1 D-amino acid dehydrogenase small subunit [Thalassovita autumnalis]CUH71851.1 D-amino acid dehydrogenase small subunit [Thalassovita autumnalis]